MKHLIRAICAVAIAVPLTTTATASYSAGPPAPLAVTLKARAGGFQLTWIGLNLYEYQVAAGYTEDKMKKGALRRAKTATGTLWEAGPGQQLCFWVRAKDGARVSAWVRPSPDKCAFTPGMRFPWPKNKQIYLSRPIPPHEWQEPHNPDFPLIKDEKVEGKPSGIEYNIKDSDKPGALDFTLYPGNDDPKAVSSTTVRTVAWGKVLAVWTRCKLVLMDHSQVPDRGAWDWAAYLHLTDIPVKRGDVVGAGEPIGRATNDTSKCGLVSTALHVHLALIDHWQGNTGEYVDPVRKGFVYCQKYPISKTTEKGVVFSGLITSQRDPFFTPC